MSNRIIDPHFHPSYKYFENDFSYVSMDGGEFVVKKDGTIPKLFEEFKENGICHIIEPAIDLDSNEKILEMSRRYSDFISIAAGNHPTRCPNSNWEDRKKLDEWVKEPSVIAVGETGLDYHYPRNEQHRFKQMRWFIYQIKLADRMGLPLILHIRMADRDAIRILRLFKTKIHGAVVHCFGGGPKIAKIYTEKLGLYLGIGGTLLMKPEISQPLVESVESTRLTAMILESDGPYVRPVKPKNISKNQWNKACNTSLILPAVLKRISEIKGAYLEEVERVMFDNTVKLFHLEEKVNWEEGV